MRMKTKIVNVWVNLAPKALLGLCALCAAGHSLAETNKKSVGTMPSQLTRSQEPVEMEMAPSSYSTHTRGVGFERYTTINSLQMWALHGLYEYNSQVWLGGGFGFSKNFDEIIFSVDARKTLLSSGVTSLFGEANGGFLKVSGNHFIFGGRLGFMYGLGDKLKVDFAYGLELLFGDSTDHIGMTQSGDFAGRFGLHWIL